MIQTHTIKLSTGLSLAALIDAPTGDGPHPLVILLHGFTGWKEEEHLASLARELAAAGIIALRFDAPGSGDSEGTWEHDYRLTNYIQAVPQVRAWALEHLPVQPDHIGIWGHSMGGFAAIASAARYPNDFQAICGSQPSNGWKMLSERRAAQWRSMGFAEFSSSRFPLIKLPYAFFEDRQQYNALNEVPKFSMPSLFIAGSTDTLVPAEGVKKLFAAAPEPKEYFEYPTDHFYKRDPQILHEINEATVKFFTHTLLQV